MKKIAIRGGHSLDIRGASSILDEVNEDRRIKDAVILKLKQLKYDVLDVTPNYSQTSRNDLSYGVNKANNWGADYFASIHLNAGGGVGTECLYYSSSAEGKMYADKISSSISSLGFRNRGAKADSRGLYELRHTKMVANIIEICFVDTQSDADLYRKVGIDAIANAIVTGITGQIADNTIVSQPQQQFNPTQSVNIDSSMRDEVGYVTADVLNVRYTANGNIIGQLKKGDKVTLWNKEGNWYHIYSPMKGYNQAYVSCDYIKIGSNPASKSSNSGNNWIARLQAECNKQGFSNQKVDGYAGQNTLNGCPTVKQGARGNITKLLQERLNTLGYSTNGIDGIGGQGTKNAVIKFQKANGLSADGIVGQNTWRKLLGL